MEGGGQNSGILSERTFQMSPFGVLKVLDKNFKNTILSNSNEKN